MLQRLIRIGEALIRVLQPTPSIRLIGGFVPDVLHINQPTMKNLATISSLTLKYFFFAFVLASFIDTRASAKAFSPKPWKSIDLSRRNHGETGWEPRHVKPNSLPIAMAIGSGDNNFSKRMFVRGGDQGKVSKSDQRLFRELFAE